MYKIKSVLKTLLGAAVLVLPVAARAATLTTLYSFTGGGDGAYPQSTLIALGGKLYGTTYEGGIQTGLCSPVGCGTVFSVDPSTMQESVVYAFPGPSGGEAPYSGLIHGHGNLFGITQFGGPSNLGTIFEIDAATGAQTDFYDFASVLDGDTPTGGLMKIRGTLYGTTTYGGNLIACASGCGTVFAINHPSGHRILYSFGGGADGSEPEAALINVGGTLYGTTSFGGGFNCEGTGCGAVFKIDPATGTESVLYGFLGGTDGQLPETALLSYTGALYGTTALGGTSGGGTVFKVDPTTGNETVLHSFAGGTGDGATPESELIEVGGLLYGTTALGGAGSAGTVYSIDPNSGSETVVYSFTGGGGGAAPSAGLLYVGGGFYGTTKEGGGANAGTVFKLTL